MQNRCYFRFGLFRPTDCLIFLQNVSRETNAQGQTMLKEITFKKPSAEKSDAIKTGELCFFEIEFC